MTALAYAPTNADGDTIDADGTVRTAPIIDKHAASLRYFVDHWLRGVPVTGVGGGLGGRGGHPDRGMDGAAAEADLWRIVATLDALSQSTVVLSRVLPWRYELFPRLDDPTETELHWFVGSPSDPGAKGGWSVIADPRLADRIRNDEPRRAALRRHQLAVQRGHGHAGAFYRAVKVVSAAVREQLDPGWIVV